MKNDIKISVSIVEDDIIHYKLMKQSLDDDKYEVSWYQNGAGFFESIHSISDIVTLDRRLPDISGLEILKKIY